MNEQPLIQVKIIPQPMDENFNALMDAAHKQQNVALMAPVLMNALREIVKNDPYCVSSAGIIARSAIAEVEGR